MIEQPVHPKFIIFEPNYAGHRMNYCRVLSEYAYQNGWDLMLATSSEGLQSDEFKLRFNDLSSVRTIDLGALPDIADSSYFRWVRNHLKSLHECYPEYRIVVLEGDKLLPHLVAWLFRLSLLRSITVLVMRMPSSLIDLSYQPIKAFAKRFSALLLRFAGADVVGLQPSSYPQTEYLYHGFRAVPDPIDIVASHHDVIQYRENQQLVAGVKWFGVFGNITPRKNLDKIARGLSKLSNPQQSGLLVAGLIDGRELERCNDALDDFEAAGGSLRIDNRLLSDIELDSAIASVGAVVVAHSTDGPSGIVGKAVAAGIPLVVAGAPTLMREINRFPGSGEFVSLDVPALAKAFGNAMENRDVRTNGQRLADRNEFARVLLTHD